MKKIIILNMLLAIAAASFGQQNTPDQHWKESDYYKKSKKQKTAAWILTGAGVVGLVVTMGVDMGQTTNEALTSIFSGGTVEEEHKSLAVPYLLSAASVISGTYLFFAASKNRKKAKASSVSINMEKAPVIQGTVFSNQSFPALSVRIGL